METEKKQPKKVVVGFWFRLLSDIIDAVILGLFGFLIAIPLKGVFFDLGENGLFIGLFITFLYTGILQSHIGKGQSLAKKLLKIQVLSIDGSYLSLPKSFFRYSVIALIFYNAWIWTALTSTLPFLNNPIVQSFYTYFIIFLFFGVAILIAFHPLKRGLHDLIANSIVVRSEMYDRSDIISLTNRAKVKRAFIVWGACCLIIVGASIYMLAQQSGTKTLIDEMTRLQQKIESDTNFKNVTIRHTYHTFTDAEGQKTSTTSINIFPFLHKNRFDDSKFRQNEIEHVAKIVARSYSEIDECDYINIQARTGFNIGISNFYERRNTAFDTEGNRVEQKNETPDVKKETKL